MKRLPGLTLKESKHFMVFIALSRNITPKGWKEFWRLHALWVREIKKISERVK
jgi:hypothetical protein